MLTTSAWLGAKARPLTLGFLVGLSSWLHHDRPIFSIVEKKELHGQQISGTKTVFAHLELELPIG
jgi:hypothetical protein